MAGEAQDNIWPLPKFNFNVKFGDGEHASFQEISGLETETQTQTQTQTQTIEYKHGHSKVFSTIKMPGIAKKGNVTMKKGMFVNNNFWDWYNQIKMNTIKRQTVVISLLDEGGKPTMTWTLINAWPTKITATDLKSEGNEVAVEAIEIAHEGLTMANG